MRYIDFKRKYFSYQILLWILLYKIDSKVITDDEVDMFSRDSFPFTIDEFTEFINYLVIDNVDSNPFEINNNDYFINYLLFDLSLPVHLEIKDNNEFINLFKIDNFKSRVFDFDETTTFINDLILENKSINLFNSNSFLKFYNDLNLNLGYGEEITFFSSLFFNDSFELIKTSVQNLEFNALSLLIRDNFEINITQSKLFDLYIYGIIKDKTQATFVPSAIYKFQNILAISKDIINFRISKSNLFNFNKILAFVIDNVDFKTGLSRNFSFYDTLAKETSIFDLKTASSAKFIIQNIINGYKVENNIQNVNILNLEIKENDKFNINTYLDKNNVKSINAILNTKVYENALIELAVEFLTIDDVVKIKDTTTINLMKLAKLVDFDNEMLFNLDNQSLSNLDIIII